MNTCKIPRTDLFVSRLAYGSTSLASWDRNAVTADDVTRAARLIDVACGQGITLFDHADIYAFGKSEAVFGRHIRGTVEGSLERLGTDRLDILCFMRPMP